MNSELWNGSAGLLFGAAPLLGGLRIAWCLTFIAWLVVLALWVRQLRRYNKAYRECDKACREYNKHNVEPSEDLRLAFKNLHKVHQSGRVTFKFLHRLHLIVADPNADRDPASGFPFLSVGRIRSDSVNKRLHVSRAGIQHKLVDFLVSLWIWPINKFRCFVGVNHKHDALPSNDQAEARRDSGAESAKDATEPLPPAPR